MYLKHKHAKQKREINSPENSPEQSFKLFLLKRFIAFEKPRIVHKARMVTTEKNGLISKSNFYTKSNLLVAYFSET